MTEPTVASALTTDKTHLPASSLSRVSPATRDKAAKSGEAMKDGSFPIRDGADLRRAIQAFGRAKDKGAAKRHIIRRARALGKTDLLPDSWKELANRQFPGSAAQNGDELEQKLIAALTEPVTPHDPSKVLAAKAEKSGIPLAKLKVVYNRGLTAAAATGRTCVSDEELAHARVNAFILTAQGVGPVLVGKAQDLDLLPQSHPAARPFA